MNRKHYQIRVYFREQPTNYYSVSAVSVKAAIRQARQCAKGLIGRGPRSRLHVEKVENLDIAGWSKGKSKARFEDTTGVYHLMLTEFIGGHLRNRRACNPTHMIHGPIVPKPSKGHKCQICRQIATKIAEKPANKLIAA